MKSCLVGVGLNIAQKHPYGLYEVVSGHNLPQLTLKVNQNQIRSSWSAQIHSSRFYEVISGHYLPPMQLKSLPKVRLGQVGARVSSNIVKNQLLGP